MILGSTSVLFNARAITIASFNPWYWLLGPYSRWGIKNSSCSEVPEVRRLDLESTLWWLAPSGPFSVFLKAAEFTSSMFKMLSLVFEVLTVSVVEEGKKKKRKME